MPLPLLATLTLAALALGYRLYGGFVARQYALDDATPTPAERHADGVDFVPTKPFYLLGQHFSAIAAAGPIAGPILAAQQFGWLPALLWILFGVVFIGAVHDLSTLVASVRHEGRSIAEVVKATLGPRAGTAMMAFIWVALVYVIVAFTDVTASTFVAGDPELEGLTFDFNPGGAVALASALYLALSVVMGVVERFVRPPLWLQTVVFVPAVLGVVWLGTRYSGALSFDATTWAVLILAYCFVASLTPVWALLQPRGYLGGFVLYLALAIGTVGLFFGGFEVRLPAFKGFSVPGASGLLFPFLFVTIACGACSGFHGLVCSGTTSKQISKESHCHPVGYGAMLLEGFVAVIALATVMIVSSNELAGKPAGTVYGIGLGRFFAVVLGQQHLAFAITFGAMAFSTFVFDTLDVSTRLGRYIVQEMTGLSGRLGGLLGTALTVGVPLGFLLVAQAGSWKSFWTLFGTSNQLLAALSLMGVSVWLKRQGRRYWYTLAPMLFVTAVTLTSLSLQVRDALFADAATAAQRVNGAVAVLLFALAAGLLTTGAKALLEPSPSPAPAR
ncbi:MAG: carbon starvation protein A [Myxococcaceae bacterium]|jgi:carbon starvation protein|nr:carbon starvation protein A [Myxococcaceae bacterium]